MEQLELDIAPIPEFLVGCRVDKEIQHYRVQAMDWEQAALTVQTAMPKAKPILVLVK